MRVLSGIQPSGRLHLGNYLGAMKQHIELQEENDCFFFIANYHSLTTVQDAVQLRDYTRDVAFDYMAMGLDPEKVALFRQTDVPEVAELAWVLSTVTGKGLLERATSYKDKVAKNIMPSMGLFNYPILMAADILIFKSDIVPVGKDQIQHVEMAQDMAGYFNNVFKCEVLKRPEWRLNDSPYVPGVDGQKMSKSYDNTIPLFETAKKTKKRIMSMLTDSKTVEEPKDPDSCNVFALYTLVATEEEVAALRERYIAGGMGYGDAKKQLAEAVERILGPAREKREHLESDPALVENVLQAGAEKARNVARGVMEEVRDACGLMTGKDTHR